MGRHRLWVLIAVAAICAGCEDEVKDCIVGVEVICSCPSSGKGTKTCQAGGVWGPCKGCGGTTDGGPDGTPGDGPVGDGQGTDGVQKDVSLTDGVPDKKKPGDTGPADVTITDAPVGPSPWHLVPMNKNDTLYAVWGSGPTNIFAVGAKGTIVHFNGLKPTLLGWFKSMNTGVSSTLHGIWGSGPRDVFAVGEGGSVLHNDGQGWKTQTPGITSSFRTVWGTGFSNVFALGEFGTVMNNGRTTSPNTWTSVKPGSKATFLGAWSSGSNAFLVVGSGGTILSYNGGTWKTMASGTTNHLWGVWAASANKAFAVGEKGTIVGWDGSAWKTMASGTTDTLFSVWGSASNNVFAVGDNGVILRYNGSAWTKMSSGTKNGLRGVWGSGPNNVFAVGENMTILNYGPCNCKVGKLCYATGDRNDNGCKACVPSSSTTSLTNISSDCTINTACYKKGEKDSTQCKVCDPTKSKTSWSQVGGVCSIAGQCWSNGQMGATHCQQCQPNKSTTAWTMVGNKCLIGGKCLASGTKDSTGCKVCDPTKSGTAWTVVPNKCNIGGTCYANGQKDTSGCRVCDPKKNPSGWTEIAGKCFIGGKCYNKNVGDGSGCRICDTTKNTKAWTVIKNKCYIDGKCVGNGVKDPTATCRYCAVPISTTAWTLKKNYCYVNSKCYGNGAKDTSGCQSCNVSKSTTAWTIFPNKCLIGSKCVNGGQKDATGCQQCDPAKNVYAWTLLGCPSTLPKHKVTFAQGSSTSNMTLATIDSDGTGYQKVPGYGTLYLSYYAYLYGRVKQYYPFTRNVPQQLTGQPYYPISLPNGLGHIKYFRDYNGGKYRVGVWLVKPDGGMEVLYTAPTSSTSYLYNYFAVSDDGKWVASHNSSQKFVILMRTDGKKFSNGKNNLELKMSPQPYYIYPTSITLTNKFLYVITRTTSSYASKHTLWRAPADGSGQLKQINLPMVGGTSPMWIDDEIAFSADGNTAVVTAGKYYSSSYSNSEDVITIDATGKAVNVTKAPANYEERGYSWGYYSSYAQLDVSPSGKHVAWIKYMSSSKHELFVGKADGTGPHHFVTSPGNFSSTYVRAYNVKWMDDDNLIFTSYGSSASYNDIYRFQVSTATVSNLTKHSKATKPFTLCCGYHYIYGMWMSPNRKFLYYISYKQGSPYYTRDIKGIDLTTWKVVHITTGAEVYQTYDAFSSCGKKPIMFFAAEPKAINYTREQLFMFDMNKGTKAVQLTNIKKSPSSTTYWYIYDVAPSADCGSVAFRTGYSSYYDLHTVKLGPPPLASNVTEVTTSMGYSYIYDYMGIAGDNSQVIYFKGPASNRYDMWRGLTIGKCCKPKKIYTGTSTYKYWYLFGVK